MPSLVIKRLAALDSAVRAQAIPITGAVLLAESPPVARLDYTAAATPAQRTQGDAIVSAFDWSQAAQDATDLQVSRSEASSLLSGLNNGEATLLRAIASVLVDEINISRGWTVSFKAEVAAATSLANLQTRVATLPTLGDRTLAQARTAILAKIAAGLVDS